MTGAPGAPEPIDFDRLAPRRGYRLAIVGSNGGIGAALAARAATIGVEVLGLDTPAAIRERPLAVPARSFTIDVREPQSVADAFAEIGAEGAPLDG